MRLGVGAIKFVRFDINDKPYIVRRPQVKGYKRSQDEDAVHGGVKDEKDKKLVVVLTHTVEYPWAMAIKIRGANKTALVSPDNNKKPAEVILSNKKVTKTTACDSSKHTGPSSAHIACRHGNDVLSQA